MGLYSVSFEVEKCGWLFNDTPVGHH